MARFSAFIAGIYVVCFILFRTLQSEEWAQDGRTYVIYPQNAVALYYLFRPLSYADAYLTGTRTHIGPHQRGAE